MIWLCEGLNVRKKFATSGSEELFVTVGHSEICEGKVFLVS